MVQAKVKSHLLLIPTTQPYQRLPGILNIIPVDVPGGTLGQKAQHNERCSRQDGTQSSNYPPVIHATHTIHYEDTQSVACRRSTAEESSQFGLGDFSYEDLRRKLRNDMKQ